MNYSLRVFLLMALSFARGVSALTLSDERGARAAIIIDAAATPTESFAARELASHLKQITGMEFNIRTNSNAPDRAILVGRGAAAHAVFPDVPFDQLGGEEVIIRTRGERLLLAGGRPRGTLYAVSRFLQDQCGLRWWTPWASRIPKKSELSVGELNVRTGPAFEYREAFWYPAFDADWSWRNGCNGQSSKLTPEKGGRIIYKGFVHTFNALVPPEKHFAEHPEWFSLIQGKRTTERAQLCLTNPKLRDFTVERVKEWLRESPDACIISVSQNDWRGACECADCKALDDAEGSHAGTVLAFVNHIAEKIEKEFPHVAVDTLAYQYTRQPPKTLRPRTNVIVRLCSIECNFREPLDHASNASFTADIRGWAEHADRLYIWDYTTDFAHYVQPHPNWFALGANVRFFQTNKVRGVFEQGAYQSHGSEMAELRAWMLAQLLWNPQQDDRALIREFLEGYYGPAAKPITRYLELMHEASRSHNLTCSSGTDAPFLRFKPLAEAEQLWQEAERAVAGDEELKTRVRLAHLPVRYVWLARWGSLRKECTNAGANWPLPDSSKQVADEWRSVAEGVAGKRWTKVTLLNEGGLTPEKFLARFAEPAN
jgi:hypothetical protein